MGYSFDDLVGCKMSSGGRRVGHSRQHVGVVAVGYSEGKVDWYVERGLLDRRNDNKQHGQLLQLH